MTRNWNWLVAAALALTLTACSPAGATGTEALSTAPDTSAPTTQRRSHG